MNNMKTVIFVGSLSNKYIDTFKSQGYTVGFFRDLYDTDIDKFLPDYLEKLSFIYSINMKNKSTISDSLKSFQVNPETILVGVREKHYYTTALLADMLKLKQATFFNINQAQYLTNKFYQRREMVKQFPEITPHYKKIRTFHGAYLFARKYGFPVVVKPANLSKGELVNICNNFEELSRKVSYVLDHIEEVYTRDKVYRKAQVVVEEFIDGRQFSVDSYIDEKGEITHTPICKQVISHDLGFDDFQTYYSQYPSELNSVDEKKVFTTVEKAIKSLNIVSGTTHTEVKIKTNGECNVIEVNVRPGGYRSEMLEESYNIDHFTNFVDSLLGKKVVVSAQFLKYSACPQFWAEKEGQFVEILDRKKIKELQSLVKFKVVVKPGDEVGPVNKGYGRVAYAILAHKNKAILTDDIKKIRELTKITTN
jgi:formate-dependent phosphoribosylglycinamide formyltransferase (GAR transformylase)